MPQKRRGTPSSQAGSALHTMSVLQVFQAKLLQDMDESGRDPNAFTELRTAMDMALRATKATAQPICKAMAYLVVLKCHLWLKLMEIRDAEKMAFLDSQSRPRDCSGLPWTSSWSVSLRLKSCCKCCIIFCPSASAQQLLQVAPRLHPLSNPPSRCRLSPHQSQSLGFNSAPGWPGSIPSRSAKVLAFV